MKCFMAHSTRRRQLKFGVAKTSTEPMRVDRSVRSRALQILFLVLTPSAAMAATYYVSPSGSDANPGTTQLPFRTLQRGADVAIPGDTVIALDGIYTSAGNRYGDRVLQINHGGTQGNPVTFKALNKGGAILQGQGNASTDTFGVVFLDGSASHTVLDGFEIRSLRDAGLWLFGTNAVPLQDVVIVNNHVHGIGRVMVVDCADGAGRVGAYANGYVHDVVWDDNVWHDIGRIPNLACDANPGSTPNYRHDHGLYLQGKYHTVVNNIFYNMYAGWAIKVDGFYGALASPGDASHTIVNNTFAHAAVPRESTGHIRFFANTPPETDSGNTMFRPVNVIVENNISFNPPFWTGLAASSRAPTFIAALYDGVMNYSGTVVRNNITTAASIIDEAVGGAEIRNKVTMSGNMPNTDPLLVAAIANDFHLTPVSPAIGAGTNGIDAGALAYAGSPPAPPTVADTTPPDSTITAPVNDALVTGAVTVAASANDNLGVVRVDFYVDTTLIASASKTPFAIAWDSTGWTNGYATLSVKAYDSAGNYKSSPNVFVRVSN